MKKLYIFKIFILSLFSLGSVHAANEPQSGAHTINAVLFRQGEIYKRKAPFFYRSIEVIDGLYKVPAFQEIIDTSATDFKHSLRDQDKLESVSIVTGKMLAKLGEDLAIMYRYLDSRNTISPEISKLTSSQEIGHLFSKVSYIISGGFFYHHRKAFLMFVGSLGIAGLVYSRLTPIKDAFVSVGKFINGSEEDSLQNILKALPDQLKTKTEEALDASLNNAIPKFQTALTDGLTPAIDQLKTKVVPVFQAAVTNGLNSVIYESPTGSAFRPATGLDDFGRVLAQARQAGQRQQQQSPALINVLAHMAHTGRHVARNGVAVNPNLSGIFGGGSR